MESRANPCIFIFIILISFLSIYVTGCGQTPEAAEVSPATPVETATNAPAEIPITAPVEAPVVAPAETPVTATGDTPTMSEEEVYSQIWSQLPGLLPDEYEITQFSTSSRKAEYKGDGKWTFSASGSESSVEKLPSEIVEKIEDYWVEQKTSEITTCDLLLSATYHENFKTIDDVEVLRLNDNTRTETVETPVNKEFKLNYIQVIIKSVHSIEIGCEIENTGRVPLKNLQLKIYIFEKQGEVLTKAQVDIEPSVIERRKIGKVFEKVAIEDFPLNADTQHFSYGFVTASGSPFDKYPSTPGEKDRYYHGGQEQVTP